MDVKKVFVTGGSGFVGGAAIRRFVAKGFQVRAMSRSEKSDEALRALGAEPVRCDLENVTAEHVGSAELILHAAAFVEAWGPEDAWDRINVAGTQRMLAAARAAGAKRFIHIGTEAALVHGQDLRDADETAPLALHSPYPYCRTKALAERAVIEANDSDNGFTTLVLRPRFIWGPGDTTILPSIEAMVKKGGWAWINGGAARTSTTHIDNLVAAILLAVNRGRGGEAYFVLDDGTHTMREMITGMARSRDLTLPDRSIPVSIADGATYRLIELGGVATCARFSPDGSQLAVVLDDGRALLIDLGTEASQELLDLEAICGIEAAPGGCLILKLHRGPPLLFNPKTAQFSPANDIAQGRRGTAQEAAIMVLPGSHIKSALVDDIVHIAVNDVLEMSVVVGGTGRLVVFSDNTYEASGGGERWLSYTYQIGQRTIRFSAAEVASIFRRRTVSARRLS